MLHTKFNENRSTGSSEYFWRVFTIWAWWPPWSCNPDTANKLSFPLQVVLEEKISKNENESTTDAGQ